MAGDVGTELQPKADPTGDHQVEVAVVRGVQAGVRPFVDYGDLFPADTCVPISEMFDQATQASGDAQNPLAGAATEVVDGGQEAIRGAAATEVVDGGQEAVRAAAATEVVDGGQEAVRAGAATEVVNGGQQAQRAASAFDDIPVFIRTPEYDAVMDELLDLSLSNGCHGKQGQLVTELRSLEVLDHPDKGLIYAQTGESYVPKAAASSTDEIVDVVTTGAEAGSAGRKIAGQVLSGAAAAADFVVDPALGLYFYEENLATGKKVFGDGYVAEVYANLQLVPALGGPIADVTACITTVCKTDWWTVIFGPEEVPEASEVQAAIDHYLQLEARKDYDANHGNLHQDYLWKKVLEAKAKLRSMGVDPSTLR